MPDKLILDGMDYTGMTKWEMWKDFYRRSDSLCNHKGPEDCDCSQCPTKELCRYLMPKRPKY